VHPASETYLLAEQGACELAAAMRAKGGGAHAG
jgi:hypothetical protein